MVEETISPEPKEVKSKEGEEALEKKAEELEKAEE